MYVVPTGKGSQAIGSAPGAGQETKGERKVEEVKEEAKAKTMCCLTMDDRMWAEYREDCEEIAQMSGETPEKVMADEVWKYKFLQICEEIDVCRRNYTVAEEAIEQHLPGPCEKKKAARAAEQKWYVVASRAIRKYLPALYQKRKERKKNFDTVRQEIASAPVEMNAEVLWAIEKDIEESRYA